VEYERSYISKYGHSEQYTVLVDFQGKCNDLKLELRLQLRQRLEEV